MVLAQHTLCQRHYLSIYRLAMASYFVEYALQLILNPIQLVVQVLTLLFGLIQGWLDSFTLLAECLACLEALRSLFANHGLAVLQALVNAFSLLLHRLNLLSIVLSESHGIVRSHRVVMDTYCVSTTMLASCRWSCPWGVDCEWVTCLSQLCATRHVACPDWVIMVLILCVRISRVNLHL